MKKTDDTRTEREKYLYHNTQMMLRKYRDVVWSIDVAMAQIQINFQMEMNTKIEDFLETAYDAGADLSGTEIQEQLRTMERNRKMLKIIETAVSLLRKRQGDGELYYSILYHTYLTDTPIKSTQGIIEQVGKDVEYMSWKTYFNKRNKAVEVLSTILWGFTTKDSEYILNEFVDENE